MGVGVASAFDTLLFNRIGVNGLTALSLLVLALSLRQRRLSDEDRAQQQRDIPGERDRLEREVRHRTPELTDLARHLETAREDEKARRARDLHDELEVAVRAVGQCLRAHARKTHKSTRPVLADGPRPDT